MYAGGKLAPMSASLQPGALHRLLHAFASRDAVFPEPQVYSTPDSLAATMGLAARLHVQAADAPAHDLWRMMRIKLAQNSRSTEDFVWATIDASETQDAHLNVRAAREAIARFQREQYEELPEEFVVETDAMGVSCMEKLSHELAEDRLPRLSLDIHIEPKPRTALPLWQVFCAQYRDEVLTKPLPDQPRFVEIRFDENDVWKVNTDWMLEFYQQHLREPNDTRALEALSDAYMFLRTLTGDLLLRSEHVDKVIAGCKPTDGHRLFDEGRLSAVPLMNWKDKIDKEDVRTELWTLGFAYKRSRKMYQGVWHQTLKTVAATNNSHHATVGQLGLVFDRSLQGSRAANVVGVGAAMALINGRGAACGPSYNYILFTVMPFLKDKKSVQNSEKLLGLAIDGKYYSTAQ